MSFSIRLAESLPPRPDYEPTPILFTAAFQDIPKQKRCSSDVPRFIELFCGMRRALGLPMLL
jgi:hypothetical protein